MIYYRSSPNFTPNGKTPRASNATFLTLIPKKKGASANKDYRPISPISTPYKILPKVLSNCIQEVLHDVRDGNQFAFIKATNITDCILIANESVEDYQRHKKRGTLIKLRLRESL